MPKNVINRVYHIADCQNFPHGVTLTPMDGTPIGDMDDDISINDADNHDDEKIIDKEANNGKIGINNDSIINTENSEPSSVNTPLSDINEADECIDAVNYIEDIHDI